MSDAKVTIRLLKNKDYEKVSRLMNKDITQWLNTIQYPPQKKDIISWIKSMQKRGKKTFVIILKSNPVGMIWLENLTENQGEIGFWINKKSQGRGYTKQAAILVLDYANKSLNLTKIRALTVGHNIASQRILESLGFKLKRKLKRDFRNKLGRWCDVLIYEK